MKRFLVMAIMMVLAMAVFAEIHTIVLISRVERTDAQFTLRDAETGVTGASVVYSTDRIVENDVSVSFEIVNTRDSNCCGAVRFDITATELMARVNGRLYCTDGVQILIDGQGFGSHASFMRTDIGPSRAGEVIEYFNVVWPASGALVEATYQAVVTLGFTAS